MSRRPPDHNDDEVTPDAPLVGGVLPEDRAAQTFLNYEPKIDFREGLERTVAWYREQVNV